MTYAAPLRCVTTDMEDGKAITDPTPRRPLLLGVGSPLPLGSRPDVTSVRDGLVLGPESLLQWSIGGRAI